jgi:hypothetical protein
MKRREEKKKKTYLFFNGRREGKKRGEPLLHTFLNIFTIIVNKS